MPNIDLTITVSVILALCAIIVPCVTTWINNRHQLKMRTLEIKLQEKKESSFYQRSIYENYLKNTMRCIHCDNQESMHLYDESYALALIYFPAKFTDSLIQINQCIVTRNGYDSLSAFNELSKEIRKLLKTM